MPSAPVATQNRIVHAASTGHVLFATTLIGIGLFGLATGRFTPIWDAAPATLPARGALAYLCAAVALVGGLGSLVRPTAALAARLLLLSLSLWLLLIKLPYILAEPAVEVHYESAGETALVLACACVLYGWLAADQDSRRARVLCPRHCMRAAWLLGALALTAFGLSHFAYLRLTAPLVPHWLGGGVFWAYLTGSAYLAAAAALFTGRWARLASVLAATQMGLFTLLVWVPRILIRRLAGPVGECVDSWVLTVSAWVLAESLRADHRREIPGGSP
jgi:uncharacterized membrane protein